MKSKSLFKNWILPLIIILVGVGAFKILLALKPKAQFAPPKERVVAVETIALKPGDEPVQLQVSGTVEAAQQIALMPEVSGRISKLAEGFKPGGVFKTGETMIQLNPVDLKAALAEAESALAQAEYAYRLELGQQAIAKHEWEMVEDRGNATELEKNLTLRKPQLAQAQAALEAAKATVEKAKLNVRRAAIEAPFNAQIVSRSVEVGSQVTTQSTLATIAGTDEYWVSATIAVSDLQWLDIPGTEARILLGDTPIADGEVFALEPALETNGRLARILIRIPDPLSLDAPLLLGSYIHADLTGKTVSGVFALPADAVHNGSTVWLANAENRLEEREISILWQTKTHVFTTTGLKAGEQLILTDIPSPIPGLKLSTKEPAE